MHERVAAEDGGDGLDRRVDPRSQPLRTRLRCGGRQAKTDRLDGRGCRRTIGSLSTEGRLIPARGIQHIDLAVSDVERSLGFYHALLGPLGLTEYGRVPSYRGTEEVVYLRFGRSFLGLRPADGGTYCHYDVGLEHLAFQVDTRLEVDEAHERCVATGARIESPPQEHYVDTESEDYYAFFAFDPDGIRVEVVCDRMDMAAG